MLDWVERRCVFYNWGPVWPLAVGRRAPSTEVWIETDDGERLHGLWFEAPADRRVRWPTDRPPVVLFLHGNAGTVKRWEPIGGRWQDAVGADVLLIDYRGYGRSSGSSTEEGLYRDAEAAYRWLTELRGVSGRRIVLVGQSLGGGVATHLAIERDHAALILESTFASLGEVADRLVAGLPIQRVMRSQFRSEERLRGHAGPVLVSHGDRDLLIPVAHARRLVEAAAGPKELVVVPRMGHTDRRGCDYEHRAAAFLRRHLLGPRGAVSG